MEEKNEMTMRSFVYHYIPKIWKESIGTVCFVPWWNKEEFLTFQKGIFPSYIKWYFKDAIQKYFEEGEK